MYGNVIPHEILRQLYIIFDKFDASADPRWALRQIRDIVLHYWRSLSSRYPEMRAIEKGLLCKVLVFEAMRRIFEEKVGNNAELRKLQIFIAINAAIERGETVSNTTTRFFHPEAQMSGERLTEGCSTNEAFNMLITEGCAEARMELQTIVYESTPASAAGVRQLVNEWIQLTAPMDDIVEETQ